jgi:hypothetical protein
VITAVDDLIASVAKVKEYQLLGSNNPLLKAQADYGTAEHGRRQGKCTAKEIPISNCTNPHPRRRDCKMDCVMVSSKQCTIIEIKPREAEELGQRQVRAYEQAVLDLFARSGKAGFTDRLAVFSSCVADDGKALNLTRDVELYDFCSGATQLGPPLPAPSITIPEDEE